jgi:hypothetical protein
MVKYSDNLVWEIEETLREAFKVPIKLNRRSDRKAGPFHVVIQDSYQAGTRSRDGRFACEIRTPGVHPEAFYAGFVALFGVSQAGEDMHAHVLQHVSVSLFQAFPGGDIHNSVRAEWDLAVINNPKAHHAQPHWHFTQSATEIESVVRTLSSGDTDFGSDLIFEKLLSLRDVHFAMSRLWDAKDSQSYKYDFAEKNDFIKWFEQLVKYIAAQLVFVCGGQASEVMEFQA